MAGNSGWVVTGQATDQVINTQAGQSVVGVQIYFVTGDGNEGSVFIANHRYTPKRVREEIHKAADVLDEVGRLTSAHG